MRPTNVPEKRKVLKSPSKPKQQVKKAPEAKKEKVKKGKFLKKAIFSVAICAGIFLSFMIVDLM